MDIFDLRFSGLLSCGCGDSPRCILVESNKPRSFDFIPRLRLTISLRTKNTSCPLRWHGPFSFSIFDLPFGRSHSSMLNHIEPGMAVWEEGLNGEWR